MVDGITFRTSPGTGVKWETGKGANLTPAEVDDNFWELLSRLETLEGDPPTAVSISNIVVIGSQVQFFMSDASTFGPFSLPVASLHDAGEYVVGTPYDELDVISVAGEGLFLVRIAHNGEDPFDPARVDGGGHPYYTKLFGENAFIYDLGWFYPGRPGLGIAAGKKMAAHVFAREVTLPAGLPGSIALLGTAAAAPLSFPLYKLTTPIGSINFAAAATVGTFTFAADVDFDVGDLLGLGRPVNIDSAALELTVTIVGQKAA